MFWLISSKHSTRHTIGQQKWPSTRAQGRRRAHKRQRARTPKAGTAASHNECCRSAMREETTPLGTVTGAAVPDLEERKSNERRNAIEPRSRRYGAH